MGAAPLTSAGARSELLTLVGQVGGPTRAVALAGDVAYVGRGPRVLTYAACRPLAPIRVGQSAVLPGPVLDVVVRDGLLYAALGRHGLAVLDLTAPAWPRLVDVLPLYGVAARLVPEGDRLYVVSGYGGLRIVSLAEPLAPRELGHFQAVVSDAVVLGTTAYVVKRDFTVVDVADPAAPRQIRKLADWADAVALHGRTLVVAVSAAAGGAAREGGVEVYDLADPRAPAARGRLGIGAPARLLRFVEDTLVALQPDRAVLLDVTDPRRPRATGVGSFATFGTIGSIAGARGALLLAAGPHGLRAVDITPAGPRETHVDEPLADAQAVAVAAGVAYVKDRGGAERVRVFDLREPGRPHELVHLSMGVAREAMVADGTMLVVGTSDRALVTFHVADPARPRQTGRLDLSEPVWAVAADGARLVVANDETVRVVDVGEDGVPREVGSSRTSGGATDVALHAGVAYVTGPATGLETGRPSLMAFEIGAGGRPRERAAMPDAAGWHHGLAARDGAVYLAGLQVVEAMGAASLRQVGRWDMEGETRALELADDLLLAAVRLPGGGGRLVAYDVSQPLAPRQAGAIELLDEALDVAVWGDLALVAAKEAGLMVIRIAGARPAPTAERPAARPHLGFLPVAARGPIGRPCPGWP